MCCPRPPAMSVVIDKRSINDNDNTNNYTNSELKDSFTNKYDVDESIFDIKKCGDF